MNDNYLWDKSGEPDEEVQHLERLLSEFRYQPRPLVLPEETPKRTIFSYFQVTTLGYAAIAAVLLLALGLGLWLKLRPGSEQIVNTPAVAAPTPKVEDKQEAPIENRIKQEDEATRVVHRTTRKPSNRALKTNKSAPNKSLDEVEGERAKEKVLYALQITSEKLDQIAKRIQTD